MADTPQIKCPACKTSMPYTAAACPNCKRRMVAIAGNPNSGSGVQMASKTVIGGLIAAGIILVLMMFCCFSRRESSDNFRVSESQYDNRTATFTPSNTNSSATIPSSNLSPEKGKEEKSFSFTAQGGKKIAGYVYPDPKKSGSKIVVFTPFPAKTDGDLYNAALNSLWNVYGKQRGLFQLADAKPELDSSLGGNAICWGVSNPKQQFCVFPIKDSGSGEIASLRVWLR